MPALVATDVTITLQTQGRGIAAAERISPREKKSFVKIAFGDGALTYPALGVPMPTAPATWGFIRSLNRIELVDSEDAQGILWKVDHENTKLRAYIEGLDVTAAGADTLDDFPLDTTGETLAEAASIGAFGLEVGVNLLGRLHELKTTSAPLAQTLFAHAYGW